MIGRPAIKADMPVNFPLLPGLYRYDLNEVPSCIYFLIYKSEVVYIGKSIMLPARIVSLTVGNSHNPEKPILHDYTLFIRVKKPFLNIVERSFIKVMKPKFNSPLSVKLFPNDLVMKVVIGIQSGDFVVDGEVSLPDGMFAVKKYTSEVVFLR